MNRNHRRSALSQGEPSSPSLTDAMFTEAVVRHRAGENLQAEALYRAVIALNAMAAQAAYNLGLLQQGQQRLEDAVVTYRHAVAVDPDHHDAYSNMAVALQELGRLDEAVNVYRAVIARKPDFAMAICNLGVTLRAQGKLTESVDAYQQALAIKPDYDWALVNLGAVLLDQGDTDGAIAACRRAVRIRPDMVNAWFNLASACKAACQLPEAEAALRRTIALQPDFAEAHFTLGQVLLAQGNLTEGWAEYDWRWKLQQYAWLRNVHGDFAQPRWTGEALAGKTILIYAEQGLGDAIQYVRYIPRIVALAQHVVFAVHPPLMALFKGLAGVTLIALDASVLPAFDVHCPLLSLPRMCGTTLDNIPAPGPCIHARAEDECRWHPRLDVRYLRVGIVWAGNPTQTGDRFRSPRFAAVKPLFGISGVQFVALQLGAGREDLDGTVLPAGLLDLGAEIDNFTDTAAIMTGLDLVISSCTAPLHLAGAMGVPVWGMIPYSPHFPWLLGRADSPWYPSLRLYRQDSYGSDWDDVVKRIGTDLAALAATR